MEVALAALVGLFFAAAIYLMLSKHIIRMVLGIALFGNAVNLTILPPAASPARAAADRPARAWSGRPAGSPTRCRRR